MPPKATIIEEFDDDTELPLPSRPLPNMGTKGALLEEISDDDELEIPFEPTERPLVPVRRPPQSSSLPFGRSTVVPAPAPTVIQDKTAYNGWTQIYPIYIDAKRPFKTGSRRIAFEKSVWWPLSDDISRAAVSLGFRVLHEPQSSHPRDWENPGRVRVAWKLNGKLQKPQVKTKKQLLEAITSVIQHVRPELIPKREAKQTNIASEDASQPVASTSKEQKASKPKKTGRKTRQPPTPFPPLIDRISEKSPALEAGLLIDAVKAGIDAMKQQNAVAQGGAPGGMGKGKKKVIRVRG